MCLSYQNPTQRQQNSDEATCNARLRYVSPVMTPMKQHRIAKLAESHNYKIRAAAAGNPMASEATMFHLAEDDSVLVRSWVVRNPMVPVWILQWKAEFDSDAGIRAYSQHRLDRLAELSV